MNPVTDPELLAQLNGGTPGAAPGLKPVTDPALLDQLNGPAKPFDYPDQKPAEGQKQAELRAAPAPSLSERIRDLIIGDKRPSPEMRRLAEGVPSALSLIPPVGAALSGDQAVHEAQRGNYLNAGANLLGVLPAPGVGTTMKNVAIEGARDVAASPRQRLLEGLSKEGITVPKGALANDRLENFVAGIADTPILGSPLKNSAQKAVDQTTAAVDRIMEGYGRTSPERAGAAARDAMQGWIRGGSSDELGALYKPVDDMISSTATRPLDATRKVAAELEASMSRSTSKLNQKALDLVDEAISRSGGLSYQGLRDLRTDIGARIADPDPAAGTIKPALRSVYKGLTQDLRDTVFDFGGKEALQKFDVAEKAALAVNKKREQLRDIIGSTPGTTSGESIVDDLVRKAGTKQTADIDALKKARSVMGDKDWGQISGEAIARMGRNRSNEIDPKILGQNYKALSPEGREVLFGHNPELAKSLDTISEVGRVFDRMAKMGNPSGSGRMITANQLFGGLMGNSALTFFVPSAWPLLVTHAAGAAGTYAAAALWARPATAKAISELASASLEVAKGPSAGAVNALRTAISTLATETAKVTGEKPEDVQARMAKSLQSRGALMDTLSKRPTQAQAIPPDRQRMIDALSGGQ